MINGELKVNTNAHESKTMPANRRNIRHAELLRCCIATWDECEAPSVVGTILPCKYENAPGNERLIVAQDGVWERNPNG